MGVLDKLDNATVGTKSVELILDAALDARWEALSRDLDTALTEDTKSVPNADGQGSSLALPALTKTVNEMDEIRDEVLASKVTFVFEPMDWRERIALQAEHPPRENDLLDQTRGYNAVTFIPALIRAACVKVVDADGDEATEIPDEKWDNLLGNPEADPPVKPKLAHQQVARLFAAAQQTDQGASRVPPSARFLLGVQDSGASLAQPSPGTSPRSGSAAGSRRGSRRSSTAKKAASRKAGSSAS